MTLRETPGADLDARYGRRPARGRMLGVVVTAGVLVVAAVVWLFWAQPWTAQEFWRSTGYRILDDRTVEVAWSVTLAEGQSASCAIAAQNEVHAIVGWRVVEVVGAAQPTRALTETVRTTEPAQVGLAYRCWLT
ncbi:MAG: hypothetical protein BGO95_09550 [Micrococcales bacterium 73-13]|nr:MAG: hypothetical protein BGO95_09550 [Micrococcales bacterium 73-13]